MQEPSRNFQLDQLQLFVFFAEILPDISSLELSAICGLAHTKCLVISVRGGKGGRERWFCCIFLRWKNPSSVLQYSAMIRLAFEQNCCSKYRMKDYV